MSIKEQSSEYNPPDISWGNAYVLSEDSPDRLFGKLCEVMEAMGLQPKQEEATKNLIRKIIWEVVGDGIWIETSKHNEIRNNWYKEQHYQNHSSTFIK